VPLLCTGITDKGMVRKSNQDSIFIHPQHKCFAVADGMGGHRGGDIASQLTVQIFHENFDSLPLNTENKIDWTRKSIQDANMRIFEHSMRESTLSGMGTTVVSLLIEKSKAYIANVGDSRCYLINNKMLYQLSKDHSLVQEKMNLGIYNREDATKDKMKNILVRTLGFEENLKIDIFEYSISKNDLFILCSDGLYGKVCDQELIETVNEELPNLATATIEDLDRTVKTLVEKANKYGGNDNISVIMALAQSK
jgi:serine/threonine protein phosphatase PrpC